MGGPGEFSVRGGIVDVFSPLMNNPVRIEFFGDSVDSIREFDLDDQRSSGPVQRIDIFPMQDILISGEMLRQWGERHGGIGLTNRSRRILRKSWSLPTTANYFRAHRF